MRTPGWAPIAVALVAAAAACSPSAEGDVAEAPAPAVADSVDASTPSTADDRTATPEAADGAGQTSAPAPEASTTSREPSTPSPGATSEAVATNAALLDFSARRLEGGTMDGVQLAGGDVVLWMWAPWCPQCNREAEHVARAAAEWGDEMTIVGIAGHDSDDAHRAFVEEHGLGDLLHLVDDDGSLWAQYGIDYQPAWVFIDEDGQAQVVAGGLYDDLDARLRALADG